MATLTEQKLQHTPLDILAIRAQFPALHQQIYGKPLIYLDNAATTQKPKRVLDALLAYYQFTNANVHRVLHSLGGQATHDLEKTRESVKNFIHAAHAEEIIFTAGTTASINLVAYSYGQTLLKPGDEILISHMEHHANIVPWQLVCQSTGAVLKVLPLTDNGELQLDSLDRLLTPQTKIVAITYVSNNLGTINPLQEIISKAHAQGAVVLVDAAQAVAHLPIDVQELDCDFLAFSAHKVYGPTGVGILYGKRKLLEQMPPYQGGGNMIKQVQFDQVTYNELPYKFEAGTPNIAAIIAFREALGFIQELGYEAIQHHEQQLLAYAHRHLSRLPTIQLIGTAIHKVGIISLVIPGHHPFDVGMLLDAQGIAVRTGHSCAQPLMHRLGIEGVIRASLAVYNTLDEIKQFVSTIEKISQRP
jgi:cysteine desulfurase/selenocysteine lyase